MFIGLITLRSDYLGQLQVAAEDVIRFEEFSLGPMPLNRIRQIIEGPAKVAGLKVEEGLIAAASSDAGTEDALPLLAFTLRELYDRYVDDRDGGGGARQLSLVHYAALGDSSGRPQPAREFRPQARRRGAGRGQPVAGGSAGAPRGLHRRPGLDQQRGRVFAPSGPPRR